MVYSYGSGALATMFEFRVRKPQFQKKFTIEKIASVVDLSNRLSERETVTPEVKTTLTNFDFRVDCCPFEG